MTTEPNLEKSLAKLEKWFNDVHDLMYADHAKAAKAKDGLFCKIFESAMGAHDRAWVQYQILLQELQIPFDKTLKWRE